MKWAHVRSALSFPDMMADGTQGCKHIKANGGTTFAQNMSAEVDFMPFSVQASGCADFVYHLTKFRIS